MGGLLSIEVRPKGTLTQEEAEAYVGSADYFKELVRDHQLCPCRKLKTRILYRIAELDRCMMAAEQILRAEIFHQGNQRKGEGE